MGALIVKIPGDLAKLRLSRTSGPNKIMGKFAMDQATEKVALTTRRTIVAGAALGLAPAIRPLWRQQSANNEIRLGVVGIRGRGRDHYRAFAKVPGVRVAYLCDIDERLFPRL